MFELLRQRWLIPTFMITPSTTTIQVPPPAINPPPPAPPIQQPQGSPSQYQKGTPTFMASAAQIPPAAQQTGVKTLLGQ